ncbi:hypothetical protein Sros01_72450 [Streptomyces roseochromogenus]|nr:hypothetical protein Sros01_72450 [Streptomyces roseochromogenus]
MRERLREWVQWRPTRLRKIGRELALISVTALTTALAAKVVDAMW